MKNFRIPGGVKSFFPSMWHHGTSNFKHKIVKQKKLAAFKCDSVKTYLLDVDKILLKINTSEKVIWHLNIWQLFDSIKQSEGET